MKTTRYLVIWSPAYEKGESRYESINLIKFGWETKAPHLVERRKLELKTTADPEILKRCSEWLEANWGRHLAHNIKRLSVVAMSDPVWEQEGGAARLLQSVEAMEAGQAAAAKRYGGTPQNCYVGVERESL